MLYQNSKFCFSLTLTLTDSSKFEYSIFSNDSNSCILNLSSQLEPPVELTPVKPLFGQALHQWPCLPQR